MCREKKKKERKRKRRLRWNGNGMHRYRLVCIEFLELFCISLVTPVFIHLLTSHLDLATLLEYHELLNNSIIVVANSCLYITVSLFLIESG